MIFRNIILSALVASFLLFFTKPVYAVSTEGTISVGDFPIDLSLNPSGSYAYISNYSEGTVSVLNLSSKSVETTISVGAGPFGSAINSTGTRLYVTNSLHSTVSVIDLSNNTVVSTITVGNNPIDIAISVDGTKAYVSNYSDGTINVINLSSNTVSGTINVGLAPREIAFLPDGSKAYVVRETDSQVSVINVSDNTVSGTISVGTDPRGIVINEAGTHAYVSSPILNTVTVIDLSSDSVVATVPVGAFPWGLAAAGDYVFSVNNRSGTVSKINVNSNSVEETIQVGGSPYSMAIASDGVYGYVTNAADDTVSILRLSEVNKFSPSSWVGKQSIECPPANPWINERLQLATRVTPRQSSEKNLIRPFAFNSELINQRNSGLEFNSSKARVSTATEILPNFGCKDKYIKVKKGRTIQFIAGGFTLASTANAYVFTSKSEWKDLGEVTLTSDTAVFVEPLRFVESGRYIIVLTEQPLERKAVIPTYGVRSVRYVVEVK